MVYEMVKLNNLLSEFESGGRPKGGAINKGIPSFGAEHLTIEGTFKFKNMKFIPLDYFKSLKKGIISNNDILIVKDGATTGKVSYVEDLPYREAAINEHLFRLKINEINAIPRYVFYYLFSKKGQSEILKDFRGATVGGISKKFIENVIIPLPPIPTQIKVAAALDKAQELIDKRKNQVQKYDELLQSVFLDMFGDPAKNPKGWKIKNLSELSHKITDGVHAKPDYTQSGVKFVSVKDINKSYLSFEKCKYISNEAHIKYSKRCNPEKNDLLYTKVGATYGIPAIVDTEEEFSLYVSVALIKPKHNLINIIFLKELMKSRGIKFQADRSIKGIGVPDLHLTEIKKFKIILPPLELQNKFASIVEKVENEKKKLESSFSELENNFNSIMQRAFKGELF